MKERENDFKTPSVKEVTDKLTIIEKLQHLTSQLQVEQRGIERVQPEDRHDSSLWHVVAVWWSANIGVSTMSVGILGPDQGFWESTIIIIVCNLLSLAPVAFFATLGPQFGLRQMAITRFSFGWLGTQIVCILNLLAMVGWGAIGLILSSQILFELTDTIPYRVSIIILGILAFLVAFFGYDILHKFQSYAYIPSVISVIIILVQLGKEKAFTTLTPTNVNKIGGILNFTGSVYGASIGWATTAADYNVMRPPDTKRIQIYFVTFLSLVLSMVPSEVIGAACGTAIFTSSRYEAAYEQENIGGLLDELLRPLGNAGRISTFLLLLFTAMSSSILAKYSTGFAIQGLGNNALKVPRWLWTVVGSSAVTGIALIGAKHFNDALTNMLSIVGYWISIYTCIVLGIGYVMTELITQRNIWNTPSLLPVGFAAGISSIFGIIGAVLGMQQAWFIGPIAKMFGSTGGDIGFELSTLLTAIVYPPVRYFEYQKMRR